MQSNEPTESPGATGGPGARRGVAGESKVAATIGNWKRKLLDVSKRNRALSFKPTKASTISIVDELAAEVFRQLYLRGRQMRFRPAPPKGGEVVEALALPYEQTPEDAEETVAAPDFVPYDAAELAGHHTDDVLQTSLTKTWRRTPTPSAHIRSSARSSSAAAPRYEDCPKRFARPNLTVSSRRNAPRR